MQFVFHAVSPDRGLLGMIELGELLTFQRTQAQFVQRSERVSINVSVNLLSVPVSRNESEAHIQENWQKVKTIFCRC